jgi:RNA polymerase sigma-70 factor (ECF subfamily)
MDVLVDRIDCYSASVAELVEASRAGHRDAFGQLVKRFEGTVYGIAMRRLGNYAEAEELSQDVFVKALEKLHQLKTPEAFGGWLRSIATRMAINAAVRRGPSFATEPEVLEATCSSGQTPLENVLAIERTNQVHAGLARLGSLDRETLVAFYVDGQSVREMSDGFSSPVGTIKRRLHVARKRLAIELESILN